MKSHPLKQSWNSNFKRIMVIFLMMVLGLNYFGFSTIAMPNTISHYNIKSRFILWDENEKMIDNNFTIELFYFNVSNNHTAFYKIQIDNLIYNDTFQVNKNIEIGLENNYNIQKFVIQIDNKTLLDENNIKVISGVTKNSVNRGVSQFTINLSPFQWTVKERNIFYSILTSSLLCIFISFRLLKYYRKKNGIKIING